MSKSITVTDPILAWWQIFAGTTDYDKAKHAFLIDAPQGVRLAVQPAEKSEVLIRSDRPWEGQSLGSASVLHDGGRYRMWYGSQSGMCYAESEDGFHWRKPNLGLRPFDGSTENNIVYSDIAPVFIDPHAPADERYKIVYVRSRLMRGGVAAEFGLDTIAAWNRMKAQGRSQEAIYREAGELFGDVRAAVSPDGLHWRELPEILFSSFCDTDNIVNYDVQSGLYKGYFRGNWPTENYEGGRRCVIYGETRDFRHWPERRTVLYPDPQHSLSDDIYNPVYSLYPGGRLHVMFPCIFHRGSSDHVDVYLAVSQDGNQWSYPEYKPVIPVGPVGSGEEGSLYAGPGLLPLEGNRWGLIYNGFPHRHNDLAPESQLPRVRSGQLRWAMWKPHRLVALAASTQGHATLIQRRFSGDPLLLNFQTETGGSVRVELINGALLGLYAIQRAQALPGYTFADCEPLDGDHLDAPVRWRGSADLSQLAGTSVAIRLELVRARIFAITV